MISNVAVIGAGLSGLVMVQLLLKEYPNTKVTLFEARDRVGGRTLSFASPIENIDAGASWIWPSMNPRLFALSKELAINLISEGDGSFRFSGGSQSLGKALLMKLSCEPRFEFVTNAPVSSVRQVNDRVTIGFKKSDEERQFDRVILAIPPRLIYESIEFTPELDEDTTVLLSKTRTWMAQQGKLAVVFKSNFWSQEAYWSQGNFLGPLQIMFTCNDGETPVIWGFLSHDKQFRGIPTESQKEAVLDQLEHEFGPRVRSEYTGFEILDWSQEEYTCSKLDSVVPSPWQHPTYSKKAQNALGSSRWNSKLWFVGSETAHPDSAGFLEGAVSSAHDRLQSMKQ